MLAATLALVLTLVSLPAQADETFPVVLQLPVVTLQSPSGEERKMEIFLVGDFTVGAGKATLKNARIQSPQPGEVTVTASVNRALRSLLMEVASFEFARKLFGEQLSQFAGKSKTPFADKPFQITESQLTLWDVPLRFTDSKGPAQLAEIQFVQDASGTVAKVVGTGAAGRSFDLADLEPQMESLNPWDALGWIAAGKNVDVRSIKLTEEGKSRSIDVSKPSLKKQFKDEADRLLLRGQISYRTKAQAQEQKDKAADAEAKGCLGCAACGCALIVAGGGVCAGMGYWVLSWLF